MSGGEASARGVGRVTGVKTRVAQRTLQGILSSGALLLH
jgi:hypothetical protein